MVAQCFVHLAHPLRIQGNVIEANMPGTCIGEICEIHKSLTEPVVIGYAQVIGFDKELTLLSLLNDNQGFSRSNVLMPTGKPFQIEVGGALLGSIIDATGVVKGRLDEQRSLPLTAKHSIDVYSTPREFSQRQPITTPIITGVRAIDGLLTCGQGQRMGIFAAAGCGKTSLMNMIIEHSDADVYVVGLIGERGREVTELINVLKHSSRNVQIILVYATSDRSCTERCNAAQIATTIANYFSDQGNNVLLFIDSITRYARALRDVSLSMGQLPARQGYPASVFESLPKLLERAGRFTAGSVTAFYTVLIENEDEPDVIGDEVRSILDGHIYLSKKLAAKSHFPAIDILHSISRVFNQITVPEHQQQAAKFRELQHRQREMQLYIDLGEYRPGENAENDVAFAKRATMDSFLKQQLSDKEEFTLTLEHLYECLA